MAMNSVDIVILALLASGVVFGAARGFWLTVFEYAGLVVGLMAGVWLAPRVLERVPIEATGLRVAIVMLLLGGGASIGSSVMHVAGEPVRELAHGLRVGRFVDHLAGALLTAAVTVATIWYVALSLSRAPIPALASQVQESGILRRLDRVAPPAPQPLVRLQQQLAGSLLPQLFAGLEPTLPGGAQPDPAVLDREGVQRAAASTVRIEAAGCGGVNFGSGFVVAPGRVVTNAHVVSGTRGVAVALPGASRPVTAEVLAFDPDRDVAVLAVPGLSLPALGLAEPAQGSPAAIIGYPGGGPLRVTPAVVQGEIRGEGRDIFDQASVSREILVLSGQARPGNSGGPLVDAAGRVVGVVFAGSVSRPEQSYALSLSEVAPAIESAAAAEDSLDMRAFSCVS